MQLKDQTNEDLMILYQEGSFEAFHELYHRYSERAYSYFVKNLRKKDDAEDLLQKLYQKFHSSKHLYSKNYLFEQWFFVIARSVLYDYYRKEKKLTSLSFDDLGWDFGYSYLNEKNHEEDTDTHIKHLSSSEQKLLKMKYVDNLSYKEMASIFEKSEMGLRQMVSRALKKARKGNI